MNWLRWPILLAAWPLSAQAQWQNTLWGMQEGAAYQATYGAERISSEEERKRLSTTMGIALLKFPWEAGSLKFSGVMIFHRATGGLSQVALQPDAPKECPIVLLHLIRRYGPAHQTEKGAIYLAHDWYLPKMVVSLTQLSSSSQVSICNLNYFSRVTPETEGL